MVVATLGESLIKSFERHLRAENKREPTITHYIGASRQFLNFCRAEHLPIVENVTREHVELWLERLHKTYKPHTVDNRLKGLKIFFKWLLAEGEIERDPTVRIRRPRLDEVRKDIATTENLLAIFAMLEKQAKDRRVAPAARARAERDALIVAIFYDTGLRAGELADLKTEHVDLDKGLLFVEKSKNHKPRFVRLSAVGLRYLDRYLRHLNTIPTYLLEGKRGRMTASGLYQIVTARFAEAGVKATIGPHDLRHTSASHVALSGGLSESEAMQLYGWADSDMWRHYTAQAREQAALDAHGRASPLTKLLGTK